MSKLAKRRVNLIKLSSQLRKVLEIRPSYASGDFCFSEICALSSLEHEVLVPIRQPTFQLEPALLAERLQSWHPTV